MDFVIPGVVTVLLFSIVQSVFGMGILVFGTPTLLLLGMDYVHVVAWLLPSSVTISAIQVFSAKQYPDRGFWTALLFCLPPLVGGLLLVVVLQVKWKIDLLIALALLCAAVMRLSGPVKNRLAAFVKRSGKSYLVLMGLVHGLTNMGGALLAIYASSLATDKHQIRLNVARFYLLFGLVQIGTLYYLKPEVFSQWSILLIPCAALVYVIVGNLIFVKAAPRSYEYAMTGFMGAYGVAILLKSFLI